MLEPQIELRREIWQEMRFDRLDRTIEEQGWTFDAIGQQFEHDTGISMMRVRSPMAADQTRLRATAFRPADLGR